MPELPAQQYSGRAADVPAGEATGHLHPGQRESQPGTGLRLREWDVCAYCIDWLLSERDGFMLA